MHMLLLLLFLIGGVLSSKKYKSVENNKINVYLLCVYLCVVQCSVCSTYNHYERGEGRS